MRNYGQILIGPATAVLLLLATPFGHAPACAEGSLSATTKSLLPRLFSPIPPSSNLDAGKVALGNRLFHDPNLSRDRTISCSNCHDITNGGADTQRYSVGILGQKTGRNSLTVFNVGLQHIFFWDGRARSLEEQIDGPINDEMEMASDWPTIIMRLSRDEEYRQSFKSAYGGAIDEAKIKDAIVQFEKSLNTPGAPFDRFLAGEHSALSEIEQRGLESFVRLGCAACHQGVLLGGNLFQKSGIYHSMPHAKGEHPDPGRLAVTALREHLYMFKVPSLRNVALTPPYFHDGSAPDLETAVRIMARIQLNKKLDDRITADIVAFLKTLTGALPERRKRSQEAQR